MTRRTYVVKKQKRELVRAKYLDVRGLGVAIKIVVRGEKKGAGK